MSATTLAERAAKLANGAAPAASLPVPTPAQLMSVPDPADDVETYDGDDYPVPAQVPAHVAWHRVMCDVRSIAKEREVTKGPAQFKFRGIEEVTQAFSGSLRKHGVIVGPVGAKASYTTSSSKSGTSMRECAVVVTWAVIGPMGDMMPTTFETAGEAVDYSDKSTTKAQSIALRTLLLTLGMVPVSDPEPEMESAEIERGEPGVSPQAYLAEITNPHTPRERMREIYNELGRYRLVNSVVEHEGVAVELGPLFLRVSGERWPKPKPATPQHREHPAGEWLDGCEGCIAESADVDQKLAGGAS